jgi:hypothetical protein
MDTQDKRPTAVEVLDDGHVVVMQPLSWWKRNSKTVLRAVEWVLTTAITLGILWAIWPDEFHPNMRFLVASAVGALLVALWHTGASKLPWRALLSLLGLLVVTVPLAGAIGWYMHLHSVASTSVAGSLSAMTNEQLMAECHQVANRLAVLHEKQSSADVRSPSEPFEVWRERSDRTRQSVEAEHKRFVAADVRAVTDELRRRGFEHRLLDPDYGDRPGHPGIELSSWDYAGRAEALGARCRQMAKLKEPATP